jgi:predicted aspartyl protease
MRLLSTGELVLSPADVEAVGLLLARETKRVVSIRATADSRVNAFVREWDSAVAAAAGLEA